MFLRACLTPKSSKTDSASMIVKTLQTCIKTIHLPPPKMESNIVPLYACFLSSTEDNGSQCKKERTCSMNWPIPVLVIPLPPKIWTPSLVVSSEHLVTCVFNKAIGLHAMTISTHSRASISDLPCQFPSLFFVRLHEHVTSTHK